MKRLFLIVSPYLFFCLLFSLVFILRTPKKSKEEQKIEVADSIQKSIDSLSFVEDSLKTHIDFISQSYE